MLRAAFASTTTMPHGIAYLQDLAKHSELTLVMDKVPPGRFARKDKREYDVDDAIRILNSELESQGYRLLRQKQFLVVLNLDKARTEYARPRLSQEPESTPMTTSSGDGQFRSFCIGRRERSTKPADEGSGDTIAGLGPRSI